MNTNEIKILLIEDNPGDAHLIREALSMAGDASDVQCTDRLAKGLEMLECGRFDAVLLDLSLPDSRGFSTFEQLHRRAPHLPVVVLTGLDDEELALRAVREGAQDYLVKGAVKSSTILRIVRFAIERNRVMDSVRGGDSQAPGKSIGFMGVRGGSGATTVALNAAAALARQGKSVVAIELSPYRSGFSLQLRLAPRRDLADLMKLDAEHINAGEVRNCLVQSDFGVKLLFAPQNPADSLKLDAERAVTGSPGLRADVRSLPVSHGAGGDWVGSRQEPGVSSAILGAGEKFPGGRPHHERPHVRLRVSGSSSLGVGFSVGRCDSARRRSCGGIVPARITAAGSGSGHAARRKPDATGRAPNRASSDRGRELGM